MLDTWNSFYSIHAALRSAVGFVHVSGLVAGGGCAITADLATIMRGARQRGGTDRRAACTEADARDCRRPDSSPRRSAGVCCLPLTSTRISTRASSGSRWRMLVMLLVNGALMLAGEKRVTRGEPRAWTRLHYHRRDEPGALGTHHAWRERRFRISVDIWTTIARCSFHARCLESTLSTAGWFARLRGSRWHGAARPWCAGRRGAPDRVC